MQQVTWKEWGKVIGKDKHGKPTKRTELITRSGSVVNLLKLYTKQLEEMSLHQFFKIWQLRNFNMTLENIQRGQIIFVHDFQQNLLLLSQDASSSSHWDHPQLTIHPTAVFYRCQMCTKVIKEDIIHITMDKVHDKYAVNQFTATTIGHLRKKGIDLSEIIEFTDHCSSQYKSRFTFYFMTMLGIPCTRHYFGVKHGKGPSDRAGGNFKRKIRSAVKVGHMLLNSDQIQQYCEQHFDRQTLSCDGCDGRDGRDRNPHSLFKVYNHRSIRRPTKDPNLRALEGSRDFLHVVRNTGVTGQVEYRYFDCACQSCTTHQSNCTQTEYADEWKQFQLLPGKDVSQQPPDWFKPIDITVNQNPDDEFMEIEDNMDNDTVQCDEIEEDVDLCEEEVEVERDGHEEELREKERDVHTEEVEVERDGHEADDESDCSLVELYSEPYESSEYTTDEEENVTYSPDDPYCLSPDDENVNFDWKGLLNDMKQYNSYDGLKRYIRRTCLPVVKPVVKYMIEEFDVIDDIAWHFYPKKDGPKKYVPVETIGDGNCGFRALAHVLLNDEGRHHEVRVRITFEAIMKEDCFLKHHNLARGTSVGSENRPAAYASYSGVLTPEITRLTPESIRAVYQHDVFSNSRNYNFMGVWQFHHAAEAFQRPIVSIYPRYTNRELRRDLNRIMLPLSPIHDQKRPVHVMWTPLDKKKDKHCDVKHFVALLVKIE